MIYELKIELFNAEKPAIRYLELESESSLRQVHYIIQTIFDWSGTSPALFTDYKPGANLAIGQEAIKKHPDFYYLEDWKLLDDRKSRLDDHLKNIGDTLFYTYAQISNRHWHHQIKLVDIKSPVQGRIYPHVLYFEGISPPDQFGSRLSRLDLTSDETDLTGDSKMSDVLNYLLMEEAPVHSLPILKADRHLENINTLKAFRLFDRKTWQSLPQGSHFSILDPETGLNLFVFLPGKDALSFEVDIFVGAGSFLNFMKESINDQTLNRHQEHHLQESQPYYVLSLRYDLTPSEGNQSPDSFQDFRFVDPVFSVIKSDETSRKSKLTIQELLWMELVLDQVMEVSDLVDQGLELPPKSSSAILQRFYSPLDYSFVNQEIHFKNQ